MSVMGDALSRAQVGAFFSAPLAAAQFYFTPVWAAATGTMAANTLYATPWIAPDSCSIDQIGIRVNTGAAGSAKVGIALNGANNEPGAVLRENSADLDTSAAAGLAGTITALPVVAGRLYWLLACFSAAPGVAGFTAAETQGGGFINPIGAPNVNQALVSSVRNRYTAPLTYVAASSFFPATVTGGSFSNGAPGSPIFAIRKV